MPLSPAPDEPLRLRGQLERVRFSSEDGTFSVCELLVEERPLPVTLVGNILGTQPGESVEVWGKWRDDAKFGRQFQIQRIHSVLPVTTEGIERYLRSGFIKGIGPVLAGRIAGHFGQDTLEVLDAEPGRLAEVEGVGKVLLERLVEAWAEQRAIRHVMVYLQSNGISPTFATKIYQTYGDRSVEVIQHNPYKLSQDIFGIGFLKADAIAKASGIEHEAIVRLCAGVLHTLRIAHTSGHVYLPVDALKAAASDVLGVSQDLLGDAIETLRYHDTIVLDPLPQGELAIYRKKAWQAESEAARNLGRLMHTGTLFDTFSLGQRDILDLQERMQITLAPAQRRAIEAVWNHKVTVITGGPGTGKTTIVRAIVEIGARFGTTLALAAPTGRAAKRLAEATGLEAQTIHRLLAFSPSEGRFMVHDDEPLEVDLLIVDEASMIDIYLLRAVSRALPDHARLLLVGDIDQLPSVGPGSVLADIIASKGAHVVPLDQIFRQAKESFIVRNAHRVNQGQMPEVPTHGGGKDLVDFYAIETGDPKTAQQKILDLVTTRIPQAFGLHPLDDLQILAPMYKGDVGASALNALLQAHLTSPHGELVRGMARWRQGDKVMQVRNNYEQEVFNGDVGRIGRIDHHDKRVHVHYPEDREVIYAFENLDELTLAYAITVHKSQGSEYPAVILPVVTQHYIMLQRNLLYTAITRAKRLVILVGSQKAVAIAVGRNESQARYSQLRQRLDQAFERPSSR